MYLTAEEKKSGEISHLLVCSPTCPQQRTEATDPAEAWDSVWSSHSHGRVTHCGRPMCFPGRTLERSYKRGQDQRMCDSGVPSSVSTAVPNTCKTVCKSITSLKSTSKMIKKSSCIFKFQAHFQNYQPHFQMIYS